MGTYVCSQTVNHCVYYIKTVVCIVLVLVVFFINEVFGSCASHKEQVPVNELPCVVYVRLVGDPAMAKNVSTQTV